jgi:hypothetical protein
MRAEDTKERIIWTISQQYDRICRYYYRRSTYKEKQEALCLRSMELIEDFEARLINRDYDLGKIDHDEHFLQACQFFTDTLLRNDDVRVPLQQLHALSHMILKKNVSLTLIRMSSKRKNLFTPRNRS